MVPTQLSATPSGAGRRWLVTAAATVASTGTLEIFVTIGGALLAASRILHGTSHGTLLALMATTYVVWLAALRRNLIVNWMLLEATGTSSNLLSKTGYEIVRVRSGSRRGMRAAAMAGYVLSEVAKEAPYYAGAIGTALVSESIDVTDALIFLVGTNVGAALYEYRAARLTGAFLARRHRPVSTVGPISVDVDPSLPAVGARR